MTDEEIGAVDRAARVAVDAEIKLLEGEARRAVEGIKSLAAQLAADIEDVWSGSGDAAPSEVQARLGGVINALNAAAESLACTAEAQVAELRNAITSQPE